MVTRKTKLIAAGAVLTLGLGLAWPLRLKQPLATAPPAKTVLPKPRPTATPRPLALDLKPASPAIDSTSSVAAVLPPADPFMAAATPSRAATPVEPMLPPPVYSTIAGGRDADPTADPHERVHIVHNGDTLERLAKRYLGDESRAIEIFDLNQDVLTNPHLLTIGVELRIPSAKTVAAD